MSEITDYGKVFDILVAKTKEYLISNNLKAMILGISGGIDSTVCAAICHEVSKQTGIPLIGRSLPTGYNKEEETNTSDLVGNAFCDDYRAVNIHNLYQRVGVYITTAESGMIYNPRYPQTKIADGNIQARLRMIYLYNLSCTHQGIVIDTDNLTEHNLGYWTVHGDVGDFNPIGGLWKTEVFKLSEFLVEMYSLQSHFFETDDIKKFANSDYARCNAVAESLKLKPTAGLGITSNDLEELGAESYEQVDAILQEILAWKSFNDLDITFKSLEEEKAAFLDAQQMLCYPIEVITAIAERHFKSEFKRNNLPIKISRYEI
jgi:NAD+ synthetase